MHASVVSPWHHELWLRNSCMCMHSRTVDAARCAGIDLDEQGIYSAWTVSEISQTELVACIYACVIAKLKSYDLNQ